MKPTLLNSNRHLNNLLSIIVCLGSLLFAENLEVTLKTGECYTGCLKSYSNAGIHLVTDSGNKEIVAITYRSIEKIVYENITLFTPVDLNDIKNIIKNKELNLIDSKSKDSQKAEKDTISQRVKLPPCYDDLFLYNKMKNLDAMSDSAFQHIVSLIDDCTDEMEDIGIIKNPCHNRMYTMLHNSPLDSFSEREFLILQKLREECIDFQEDLGWGINCCKDHVYLSLREKPRSTLSTKELHYLEQLEDDCEELKEDLEAGYSRLWPSDSAILNDTLSVYYDSPGTGKKFLVIGGLLLVPGLVMPIAGSSILSKYSYTSDPWDWGHDIDVASKRLDGWFLLIAGIACDCAGISLLSVGALKQEKYRKFEALKNEYENLRKKKRGDISINLNFKF